MASEEEFVFSSCTFVFNDNVFAHDKQLWERIIRLGFSMKLVESHVTVKKKSAPARDIEKLLKMISDALKPVIECDSQKFCAAQNLRRGRIEELEERQEIGETGQGQKIREDKFYTNKVAKGHVKEPETKLNEEPINAISKVNLQQKADLQKQYDELVYSKCWSPEEQINEFDETLEASNTVVIRNMPHASPAMPSQKSRREDTLSHNAQSGHHDDSQEISLDADSGTIFCDAQFENENECGALAEQIECFKEKEQATGGASRSPGKTKRECGICFQDNAIPDSSSCCKGDLCQACKEKCPFCPFCRTPFKCITGNQPEGSMTITYSKTIQLRGFEGKDSYEIKYSFPSGRQGPNHPNPGKVYECVDRKAYLPASSEGHKVLRLLRLAFLRRLTFTIGDSHTTGRTDVIVWNDVHHKTSLKDGSPYGYPDSYYLRSITEDLAAKRVTESSMTRDEQKDLSKLEKDLKSCGSFLG